jgi:hypothetical protein
MLYLQDIHRSATEQDKKKAMEADGSHGLQNVQTEKLKTIPSGKGLHPVYPPGQTGNLPGCCLFMNSTFGRGFLNNRNRLGQGITRLFFRTGDKGFFHKTNNRFHFRFVDAVAKTTLFRLTVSFHCRFMISHA